MCWYQFQDYGKLSSCSLLWYLGCAHCDLVCRLCEHAVFQSDCPSVWLSHYTGPRPVCLTESKNTHHNFGWAAGVVVLTSFPQLTVSVCRPRHTRIPPLGFTRWVSEMSEVHRFVCAQHVFSCHQTLKVHFLQDVAAAETRTSRGLLGSTMTDGSATKWTRISVVGVCDVPSKTSSKSFAMGTLRNAVPSAATRKLDAQP